MKILFRIVLPLLALAIGLAYLYREALTEIAFETLTRDMFVASDNDDFDPGPALGSQFPGLQARYHGRAVTLLNEFAGTHGTVLIASRSVDWCPYCRRQLVQLQEHASKFDAAGIGLVAITYDEADVQQAFVEAFGITIPLMSDIDALSFKTLGILNADHTPGDAEYGIPYPGMVVIDTKGRVVGKLFIEDYRLRIDAAAALAFAKAVLGITPTQ